MKKNKFHKTSTYIGIVLLIALAVIFITACASTGQGKSEDMELVYETDFSADDGMFVLHDPVNRPIWELVNGMLHLKGKDPGGNLSIPYGRDSVTTFRLKLSPEKPEAQINLLWSHERGMVHSVILRDHNIHQFSRVNHDNVLNEFSDFTITPGEWHDISISIRGNDYKLRIDDRLAAEATLDNRLPDKGYLFFLAGESEFWIDDLRIVAEPSGVSEGSDRSSPRRKKGGIPQIAVILPIRDNEDFVANDVMIGINRIAQEFEGTIHGGEGDITFGDKVEITILVTTDLISSSVDEITNTLRDSALDRFDLVIGAGYHYLEPLTAINKDFPDSIFVALDSYGEHPAGDNFLTLQFHMTDAAFLAGAMAAERFGGQPLGFIGGIDLYFIREEFLDGFVAGVDFMDGIQGTRTEVVVDFAGDFGDYERGYDMAVEMFESGVACIYQAAGLTGIGALDAARDMGKWCIGVDLDQGLEAALRLDSHEHILTSTVKKWGNGAYLVCREYLTTGNLPKGTQIVGLAEDCVDMAVNPYNAPILGDQLSMIRDLKQALIAGELPDTMPSKESTSWASIEEKPMVEIITVTVNDPVLSPGIPEYYGATLQEALSTEFHETGFYRIIDSEQVKRLLQEISFSLDGVSEESTKLEVGRLVAAEAIVFVNMGEIGEKVNVDCKLVDVETGLMIAAARESYPDFESVLEGLGSLVMELGKH